MSRFGVFLVVTIFALCVGGALVDFVSHAFCNVLLEILR